MKYFDVKNSKIKSNLPHIMTNHIESKLRNIHITGCLSLKIYIMKVEVYIYIVKPNNSIS